ncbi:MAG: ferritin-like domain-containing protein [Bdellovibrionales bacterium]|nr:ferritin-like domain-containing protein [Bdellovibrionales bacterium]
MRKINGVVPAKDGADIEEGIYWTSQFYGLDQLSLFCQLSVLERKSVLELLSRSAIDDIFFIEQIGMNFGAKAIGLARNQDEAIFFSQVTAQEAQHFLMIRDVISRQREPPTKPSVFVSSLGAMIQQADYASMIILVQVFMEGWGLRYYDELCTQSQSEVLGKALSRILEDEVNHHAFGILSAPTLDWDPTALAFLEHALAYLLKLVQMGEISIIATLDGVTGELTRPRAVQALENLNSSERAQKKLAFLQRLLKGRIPESVMESLERLNCFGAFSNREAVNFYAELKQNPKLTRWLNLSQPPIPFRGQESIV